MKRVISLSFLLLSSPCLAYMTITSTETKSAISGTGSNQRTHVHVKINYTRSSTPGDNEGPPNGSYRSYGAYIYPGYNMPYTCTFDKTLTLFPGVPFASCINFSPTRWELLELDWIRSNNNGGSVVLSYSYPVNSSPTNDACVAFMATESPSSSNFITSNGAFHCRPIQPLPEPKCYIDPISDIEFRVPTGRFNEQKTVSSNIHCDYASTITLGSTTGSDLLDFSWGSATVNINGRTLPISMNAQAGATPITVSARINGSSSTPSVEEKTMILILGYQ